MGDSHYTIRYVSMGLKALGHLVAVRCGDVLALLDDLNRGDLFAGVHGLHNLLRAHIPNPAA